MIKNYEDKLRSIIHNHLPGAKIYLFNLKSEEKDGKYMEMSIAIDAGQISDPGIIGNIYADIKKQLWPVDIDIVDFNYVTDDLKTEILKNGVVVQK